MKSRSLFFCCFLLLCAANILSQTPKTVNVATQGTLKYLITVEETKVVSTLTLTGNIDAQDFAFLRDKMKVLSILNLSSVIIKSYTGIEGTNMGFITSYPANEIPIYAFYNPLSFSYKPSLTSITLPSTTSSIGAQAFYYCWNLAGTITIPATVKYITDYAFYGCSSISAFSVANSNTRYSSVSGVLFNKNQDTLFIFPSLKSGIYSIPATVNHIGASSFENCYYVTSITFPSSITSIGSYAFSYCSGITGNLTLPASLKKLDDGAFYGCWNLTETVTIPASLTEFGNYCFLESNNLKSFSVNSANPYYSSYNDGLYSKNMDTLFVCPSAKTGTFTIPSTVKLIGSHAFYNCNKITGTITIPPLVDYIGYYSFYGCSLISGFQTDIQNLYFSTENNVLFSKNKDRLLAYPISKSGFYQMPSTVKQIDPCAFAYCTSITGTMNLPAAVNLIGDYAFYYCNQLTGFSVEVENMVYSSVDGLLFNRNKDSLLICPLSKTGNYDIPSSVRYVGISAFDGCSNLNSITIPESVEKIGSYAFEYCTGLTKLHLYKNTTSIGSGAFYNCTGLQSIEIENTTAPIIDYYTFDQVNKSTCKLIVPTGFSKSYQNVSYWGEFTQLSETDFANAYIIPAQEIIVIYGINHDILIEDIKLGEKVNIFTIQGKLIKTIIATQNTLRITAPSSGIFIVNIYNKSHKIILI